MRVLLVEDDVSLGEGVCTALRRGAFAVDWVQDGASGLAAARDGGFDLVVLDLGLPHMDGIEAIRRIRAAGNAVPILVLSARERPADRTLGLDVGADDYLGKPFDTAELLARVRALIRRSAGLAEAVLTFGALTLDTRRMQAHVDGVDIALSPLEYRLLHALAHSGGRPLSAAELSEMLHGVEAMEANAIEALVARLRRKLGADVITTRRGFGYSLTAA